MVTASKPAPSKRRAASSFGILVVAAIATTRASFSIGSTISLFAFFGTASPRFCALKSGQFGY
jgi:hypothetical protein